MQELTKELPVMLEASVNIQQKYVYPVMVMCWANTALFECSLTKGSVYFSLLYSIFWYMQTVHELLKEKSLYMLEVKKHAEHNMSLE
jgi:hypothetical protein